MPIKHSVCFNFIYWIGIIFCAIGPASEFVFYWKENAWYVEHGVVNDKLTWYLNFFSTVTLCTMIVSGFILIWSVANLRKFIQSLSENQRINIRALLIHSGVVGFFTLDVVFYTIFSVIYYYNPYLDNNWRNFLISSDVYSLLYFIS